MTAEITGPYRFTARPRPTEPGGGWRRRAYEIIPGREVPEVHGGIFPAGAGPATSPGSDDDLAYAQASAAYRDGEHDRLGWFAHNAAAQPGC